MSDDDDEPPELEDQEVLPPNHQLVVREVKNIFKCFFFLKIKSVLIISVPIISLSVGGCLSSVGKR